MSGTRKQKWRKVLSRKGEFNLFQSVNDPLTWEVSFKITDGKHARKRFNADNLEMAIELSKQKRGISPVKKITPFTVAEAFKKTRAQVIKNQAQLPTGIIGLRGL